MRVCGFSSLLYLMSAVLLHAQVTHSPSPDDPALIAAFLNFHASFTDLLKKQNNGSPEMVKSSRVTVTQLYGIDDVTLDALDQTASDVRSQILGITGEMQTYISSVMTKGQSLDQLTLGTFDTREHSAVTTGWRHLQQSLTSTEWKALTAYLNGDFRSHVSIGEMTHVSH